MHMGHKGHGKQGPCNPNHQGYTGRNKMMQAYKAVAKSDDGR